MVKLTNDNQPTKWIDEDKPCKTRVFHQPMYDPYGYVSKISTLTMDGSHGFSVWLDHWEQHQLCLPCGKVHAPKAESVDRIARPWYPNISNPYIIYPILEVDVPVLLGCIHMILDEMTNASMNPSTDGSCAFLEPHFWPIPDCQVLNMKAVSKLRSYIMRPAQAHGFWMPQNGTKKWPTLPRALNVGDPPLLSLATWCSRWCSYLMLGCSWTPSYCIVW